MKIKSYFISGFWCKPEEAGVEAPAEGEVAVFINGGGIDGYAVRKGGEYEFFGYEPEDCQREMELECAARALEHAEEARKFRAEWIKKYFRYADGLTWNVVPDSLIDGFRWLARNGYVTGPRSVREWDDWAKKFVWSNAIDLTEKGRRFLDE